MAGMTLADLESVLRPLATRLTDLDLADPGLAAARLNADLPLDADLVSAVRRAAEPGIEEGWLLPRTSGDLRFGRVTKDLEGFSVDAVLMSSPGPRHRHPRGEVDLLFPRAGTPAFDGHPPGWVVYGPDSVHVPTVTGGEMLILYFLPGGAIEFLPHPGGTE